MSNMENVEEVNFYEFFNKDLSKLDVSGKEQQKLLSEFSSMKTRIKEY